MKKRLISVFVVFLIVLSSFGLALEDTSDNCAGFWGSIGCFLWGDAANRAGMSWFDRGNALVGKGAYLGPCTNQYIMAVGQSCSYGDWTIERLPNVQIGGEEKKDYQMQSGPLKGQTFTAKGGWPENDDSIPEEVYTKINAASKSAAPQIKTPVTTAAPSSTTTPQTYNSGWECSGATCTCKSEGGCNVNSYKGKTWWGLGSSEEVTVNKGSTVKNPGGDPKVKKTEINEAKAEGTSATPGDEELATFLSKNYDKNTLDKWKTAGYSDNDDIYWFLKTDLTPDQAKVWSNKGLTGHDASDWIGTGVTDPAKAAKLSKTMQPRQYHDANVKILTEYYTDNKGKKVQPDDKLTGFTPEQIEAAKKAAGYTAPATETAETTAAAAMSSSTQTYTGPNPDGSQSTVQYTKSIESGTLNDGTTYDTVFSTDYVGSQLQIYFANGKPVGWGYPNSFKDTYTETPGPIARALAKEAYGTDIPGPSSGAAETKETTAEKKPAEIAPAPAITESTETSLEGQKGYALVGEFSNQNIYTDSYGILYHEDGTSVTDAGKYGSPAAESDNYDTAKDTAFKSQYNIPEDYESGTNGYWSSPQDGGKIYDSEGNEIEGLTTKEDIYVPMPGYKFKEGSTVEVIKITADSILADLKSGTIKTTEDALTQLSALSPEENVKGLTLMVNNGQISSGTAADEVEKIALKEFKTQLDIKANKKGGTEEIKFKGMTFFNGEGDENLEWTDYDDGKVLTIKADGTYEIKDEEGKVTDSGKLSLEDTAAIMCAADDQTCIFKSRQQQAHTFNLQSAFFGMDAMTNQDWYKGIKSVTGYFGAVAQGLQRLGSYQATSNLLMPDATKEWMEIANNEVMNTWADLPGAVSRDICGYDDVSRSESPGKSAAFIHQPSGTYQFVGQIQAERSQNKAFIMCEHSENPDIPWTCSKNQVCVNELYCHADLNKDGKPDSQEPLKGYFYKITWGVTAPADMSFTPYIDENGVAVAFNIQLQGETTKWIFRKGPIKDDEVIELKNGASDGGTIVKYLPEDYRSVCIKFGKKVKDEEGEDNEVKEICADFVISSKGEVEYGGSDRTASVTSTSPEVSMDI